LTTAYVSAVTVTGVEEGVDRQAATTRTAATVAATDRRRNRLIALKDTLC
jgi:hypothetical protein